ncbi:hypothetical protein ACLX1H_010991 [Fusarium chlamydosporum]
MRIVHVVRYYYMYGCWILKRLLVAVKHAFLYSLAISGFTVLLAFINGLVLGPWYLETSHNQTDLLLNNMLMIKTYEWFRVPGGDHPLSVPRAPFHIQQLYHPLKWPSDVGISRPDGWHTENVGFFASFNDLYRRRYAPNPSWHHWIYLSEQEQPLNETWNQDPWDKAFLDLLEYSDKHELGDRWNFNYITCPKSFLCSLWRIDAPALLHFTNEPIKQDATQGRSRKPILDPVSVRVFELPLTEAVIPDTFPTYFEQMRSITASNSTYWTTRMKYSNFDQVRGQAFKVLKKLENKYSSTYGLLSKVERKWIGIWGGEDLLIVEVSKLIAFTAGALPSHYGAKLWQTFKLWKNRRRTGRSAIGNGPQPVTAAQDPVAHHLQGFLDTFSEEDKEKWGKTYRGRLFLDRIQDGLEQEDWDSRDDIMAEIEDSLGVPRNRFV